MLEQELTQIESEARFADSHWQTQQVSLAKGFQQDLADQDELTADWIREAVAVYVAADRLVSQQQWRTQARYEDRQTNLLDARAALDRVRVILEHQHDMAVGAMGVDPWALRDSAFGTGE